LTQYLSELLQLKIINIPHSLYITLLKLLNTMENEDSYIGVFYFGKPTASPFDMKLMDEE
jgi:hypothetical protein